jgi:hypothetical protein
VGKRDGLSCWTVSWRISHTGASNYRRERCWIVPRVLGLAFPSVAVSRPDIRIGRWACCYTCRFGGKLMTRVRFCRGSGNRQGSFGTSSRKGRPKGLSMLSRSLLLVIRAKAKNPQFRYPPVGGSRGVPRTKVPQRLPLAHISV